MKNLIKITAITLLMMAGSFSFGEGLEHKPTKIEFNARIDDSSVNRDSLQTEITSYFEEDLAEIEQDELKNEKKKVVDFIDVEVHMGGKDEKQIVDRRFNSVEPAIIAVNPDKLPLNKN